MPSARNVVHAVPRLRDGFATPADEFLTGVICNPRSHRNRRAEIAQAPAGANVVLAVPKTKGEIAATLREFAEREVDLLVIDGGDGTVRDVLTLARDTFGARLPRIAVLPSGKTNALGLDLGLPAGWTLDEALLAARTGGTRRRCPIEILRAGSTVPDQRGFLFGAGGFVRATALAQRTHRVGAFNGVAVGLALVWAMLQTLFGRATSPWRRGDAMRIEAEGKVVADGQMYVLMATTLERLPTGVRPFGPKRAGLKTLAVTAPPRHLITVLPFVLFGAMGRWLERWGYTHATRNAFRVRMDGDFILDGEVYPGGDLTIRAGEPLEFVVP